MDISFTRIFMSDLKYSTDLKSANIHTSVVMSLLKWACPQSGHLRLLPSMASGWPAGVAVTEVILCDLLMLNLVVTCLKRSRIQRFMHANSGKAPSYCYNTLSVVNMMPCSPCWTQGSIRSSIRLTSDPRFLILRTKWNIFCWTFISDSKWNQWKLTIRAEASANYASQRWNTSENLLFFLLSLL